MLIGAEFAIKELPALPAGYPDGWMTGHDLRALYNLALRTEGPCLEIGPWLGRSTSAIAAGIRDAARLENVAFDVVDFGIVDDRNWFERFKVPLDLSMANGVAAESIFHPGGTIAVLIRNLKRNDLLKFTTTIVRGDFLDLPFIREYKLLFCDAVHDSVEISRNVPKIANLVGEGSCVVFDDVVDDHVADQICAYFPVRARHLTHSDDKYSKLMIIHV